MQDFDWNLYPQDGSLAGKRALIGKYIDRFNDLERAGMGLYINSATAGSGKTHLAQCIVGTLLESWNEGSARLVTEADLMEISRQKPEDGSDALSEILNCRLLILDDLGAKAAGRNWLTDVLFRVVNTRYRAHRVTLYTANQPTDAIPNERIKDRVEAMTISIELPDVSVRQMTALQEKEKILREIGIL